MVISHTGNSFFVTLLAPQHAKISDGKKPKEETVFVSSGAREGPVEPLTLLWSRLARLRCNALSLYLTAFRRNVRSPTLSTLKLRMLEQHRDSQRKHKWTLLDKDCIQSQPTIKITSRKIKAGFYSTYDESLEISVLVNMLWIERRKTITPIKFSS